ncbi:hypothetical protein IWX90DRAFT_494327 [Phyllosticta citrichinensis]|uniref:Amidohydrolase 3 domain-containing protein n=1 Tax=Phyllosticta citrichinensis TaxID=1130410 RepID=A0ABR1XIZ4_9PEZI
MDDFKSLPMDRENRGARSPRPHFRKSRSLKLVAVACLVFLAFAQWCQINGNRPANQNLHASLSASRLQSDFAKCPDLRRKPSDPSGFRHRNARAADGSKPILIRNATVWTGEPVSGTTTQEAFEGIGYTWTQADVFVENGLIKKVGAAISESELPSDYQVYDAQEFQLTSGIVDMYSHAGVDPLPQLNGNEDTNELSTDITPFVRSIDGLDPLDHQIQVIKSGGVTTSLVLPGSGNNIGGEAFVIKHAVGKPDGRSEISAKDMLADPEGTWRYMKMACGEKAKRVYGKVGERGPYSRLGESWELRHAFEQASALVKAQDEWSFVDHTNEFKFPIRAFHHAHETYIVPEILKRAWGGRPPAAALFADNMLYKAEAYRGSEQAGKILYENGITPVYVSDNPVLNAQHVVFEAAKAYRYGLPYHAALAGVTSAPAELLGLGERIGKIKPGFDADIVLWDSDPLSVGAAPVQVWIDGTAQYEDPQHRPRQAISLLGAIDFNETLSTKFSAQTYFHRVVTAQLPLVISVDSADTTASILRVKGAVEQAANRKIRLAVVGGAEAHLVVKELAAADVGVVLAPLLQYSQAWDQRRSLTGAPLTNGTAINALVDAGVVLAPLLQYSQAWDQRRSLTGAPLTNGTAINALVDAGVLTAIGTAEDWEARDLGLMAGVAFANGEGRLSEQDALALISANIYKILGLDKGDAGARRSKGDSVVYEGSPLEIRSRVVAVGSGQGVVSVFE